MTERIHVSITEEILTEYNEIPTRMRSFVVRQLLIKYFEFEKKRPNTALGLILTGGFKIEVENAT